MSGLCEPFYLLNPDTGPSILVLIDREEWCCWGNESVGKSPWWESERTWDGIPSSYLKARHGSEPLASQLRQNGKLQVQWKTLSPKNVWRIQMETYYFVRQWLLKHLKIHQGLEVQRKCNMHSEKLIKNWNWPCFWKPYSALGTSLACLIKLVLGDCMPDTEILICPYKWNLKYWKPQKQNVENLLEL